MKKIQVILRNTEFESSSTKTPQFKAFANSFKTEFKKELSRVGAKNFEFHVNHFDITGFFEINDKLFYFSLGDIRGSHYKSSESLMYRTAKHRKDWTGGSNQWVTIEEGMADYMQF
jgi:hypothetical protein